MDLLATGEYLKKKVDLFYDFSLNFYQQVDYLPERGGGPESL